ncbi:MAG TPA: class I SAM-dependent methyltransferase [Thermoplasmata archaeon]|nr:class I SAM-dependent methyltransferase [Thermoplasmata archaeon]
MAGPVPRTHPDVRGFDRAAARYERARPDYPPAAVRYLGRVLRLGPGTIVVDLGSGTGKFTRALAPLRAARVAVEPTPGMRRVFERAVPDVPVLDGTAESIPLPDGFADAVVCAQSFHWFRPRRALREIARVLRPGGGLALLWNTRDEQLPWSHRISRIVARYRWRSPKSRSARWRPAFRGPSSPFGPVREARFSHSQRGTVETFVERTLSVSVIANLPAREQRAVAEEVRAVLRADPSVRGRRWIDLPYTTEVYWSRRR